MKKKPEKLWAAIVNMAGVYSRGPILVTLSSMGSKKYWDRSGNLDIEHAGLNVINGTCGPITKFASENRSEVQVFINGAIAYQRMIAAIVKDE